MKTLLAWPNLLSATLFCAAVFVLGCIQWGNPFEWPIVKWWQDRGRGDLLLTVRNFDFNNDNELSAHLAFYNNDSIPRTVIAVRFTYRPRKEEKNFSIWDTGPGVAASFKGHIDEIKLSPQTEESKRYQAVNFNSEVLKRIGGQFGLYISFTNAARQDDSAHVTCMEVQKPADVLGWNLHTIDNLSLDLIRDSLQIEAIKRDWRALNKPPWYRRFSRFGDY